MNTKTGTITAINGSVTAAQGFRATGVKAGLKASGNNDCGLIVSDTDCTAAGTFTRNAVRASSVDWCAALLPSSKIRAVFCNAGNANACTGKRGARDTAAIATKIGKLLKAPKQSVLVASTGVIGHFLPMEKINAALPSLVTSLDQSIEGGTTFATTIMTTDLVKKEAAVLVTCSGGKSFIIGGCVKGSGMIHPNMATMLAFITTDVAITANRLNTIVKKVINRTFNNLTVDGDTSTNDMVLVLANGASKINAASGALLAAFEQGLYTVCNSLCQQIAADGEGATKRVEIQITGAKTEADARKAGKAIANSMLVKTALFGNDPNWGRILCAIGYSEAHFNPAHMSVAIGGVPVCVNVRPVPFKAAALSEVLKQKVVEIQVALGAGKASATIHTCDLTYDYIKINADYHT